MKSKSLLINELKDAVFSLKISKRSGIDNVSFNIIKNAQGALRFPNLLISALQNVVFPDDLKIAKVTSCKKLMILVI